MPPTFTALITGASSGIGYELARLFAADGSTLVLVGRDEDRLEAAAAKLAAEFGITGVIVAADLSQPGAAAYIQEAVREEGLEVDVLVNNAGFGGYGPFAESDLSNELDMIRVNVLALTELTKRFLPGMLAKGAGRVLNVASTAAFQPGPLMAVYYATKAYVLSFSEALAVELEGTHVKVTTLCPGPTATGFAARGGVADLPLFRGGGVMDAAEVARIGYRAMQEGKGIVVTGARNRLGAFLTRLVPRRTAARVVAGMQRPEA